METIFRTLDTLEILERKHGKLGTLVGVLLMLVVSITFMAIGCICLWYGLETGIRAIETLIWG